MHESVVTLQDLVAADRAAIRTMTQALDQAAERGVVLIHHARLEEDIHRRAGRCDSLEELIDEYADADAGEAAYKLILIQLSAAMMIETKNLEAALGHD
ncbi:hypothetical protein [Nonomuraea sp. KM90]|uniref:hypothetical protein n=1 Tax=Nonomuraea sp. KM90 TaxID=3457428 RepID=UPI003FCC577A